MDIRIIIMKMNGKLKLKNNGFWIIYVKIKFILMNRICIIFQFNWSEKCLMLMIVIMIKIIIKKKVIKLNKYKLN